MKLAENIIIDKFDDKIIISKDENGSIDTSCIYVAENASKDIIEGIIDKKNTYEEILSCIVANYEVENNVAKKDLDQFLQNLIENGILIDE